MLDKNQEYIILTKVYYKQKHKKNANIFYIS